MFSTAFTVKNVATNSHHLSVALHFLFCAWDSSRLFTTTYTLLCPGLLFVSLVANTEYRCCPAIGVEGRRVYCVSTNTLTGRRRRRTGSGEWSGRHAQKSATGFLFFSFLIQLKTKK